MRKLICVFLLAFAICGWSEEIAKATPSPTPRDHKNDFVPKGRIENLEQRVADIEQKTIMDKFEGKTLLTRCCEDEDSFAIYADFLWWRAQNNGFRYLYKIIAERTTDLVSMPYDWDPGFRVGLGYNSCYDGWDLYTYWTRFHNKSSQTLRNYDFSDESSMLAILLPVLNIDINLLNAGQPTLGTPEIGYCKATVDIDYDTADLLLDRDFFIGKSLALKPFFGLKALFLKQKFFVRYADPDPANNWGPLMPYDIKLENKYWGVGPKIGLNTNWYLIKELKLFANLAADLVYGERKENFRYISADENYSGGGKCNTDVLTPTFNMAVGAAFTYCFDEAISLDLHIAWETLYIWNQYMTQGLLNISNYTKLNEPLHMQGLTLGTELRF